MGEQLNIFVKGLVHCDYAEQYSAWQSYLTNEQHSEQYLLSLGVFLENFPFCHQQWLDYIHHTSFQEFQTALKRNPKSYELWAEYLGQCKERREGNYKEQLERAIMEVGADSRSLWLYQEYYDLIADNPNNRYEFYKKVFTRALIDLEALLARFNEWF